MADPIVIGAGLKEDAGTTPGQSSTGTGVQIGTSAGDTGDSTNFTQAQLKESDEASLNGTFSFLYDSSIKNPILDIKDKNKNLYVTRLSNYNNYYFTLGYNMNILAKPVVGFATAANRYYANIAKGHWYESSRDNCRKLNDGTVIANCVGWAQGRVLEVWNRALEIGYITYNSSDGKYYIKDKPITGYVRDKYHLTGPLPPPYNAVQFYDYWPTNEGWSKSDENNVTAAVPKVGALICWGADYSKHGHPGHIAFVEAVYNVGKDDEEIVISESSAATSGTQWLVKLTTLKRGGKNNQNPYKVYSDHKFRRFLYSPVCQLSSANSLNDLDEGTINASKRELTPDEQAGLAAARFNLLGYSVAKDLPIGGKVRVVGLGYKQPEGSDRLADRINNLGVGGIISIKENSKYTYRYGVATKDDPKTIIGYYSWGRLEITNDGSTVDKKLRIVWENGGTVPESLDATIVGKLKDSTSNVYTREVTIEDDTWSIEAVGLPKYYNDAPIEYDWKLSSVPVSFSETTKVTVRDTTQITLKHI